MVDEIEGAVKEMLARAKLYYQAMAASLDYDSPSLHFCIKTIPEPDIHDLGRTAYIFHTMSHAHISATEDQMKEVVDWAQLSPGDTVIYAYEVNGPDIPTCSSVSKVTEFQDDGITPRKIMHIWPLDCSGKAIDLNKIKNKKIEYKR